MIIDTSYFQNKSVFIPNSTKVPSIGSNNPDSVAMLQQEIDAYEERLLVGALGHEQYNELKEQFEEVQGVWQLKADAVQKWFDLVEGIDNWNGLRYSFGTKKISLIAYYVFFYYLKGDFSTYTTTGVQIPNSENSTGQSPNPKLSETWNTFIEMYWGNTPQNGQPTFGHNWNGTYMQWGGGHNNQNQMSLYDFLSSRPEDYDVKFFSRLGGLVNTFGL